MTVEKLNTFLQDVNQYHLFSYEEYKTSSLELKLKKIKLLNEYAKLKYGKQEQEKLEVYIDFDGVILDTIHRANEILKKEYGIDLNTHQRENMEEEKIITTFFNNLNWRQLLNDAKELNKSIAFIKQLQTSVDYYPMIYSAVNSKREEIEKGIFLQKMVGEITQKYIQAQFSKTCENENAVLIDDDDFHLIHWPGKPIHFNAGRKSIFPGIFDLGEIYYLFVRDSLNNTFSHPKDLYSNYEQIQNPTTKQKVWIKK